MVVVATAKGLGIEPAESDQPANLLKGAAALGATAAGIPALTRNGGLGARPRIDRSTKKGRGCGTVSRLLSRSAFRLQEDQTWR